MSWNNPIPWNSRTEPPYDPDCLSSGAANAASVGGQMKMSPELIGAFVSGGSSTLSSIFNYASQRATNRSNERMNRENNEYNLRLWQMNNEYNTPANQRRRMEEAGFNPNLMYGSMSPGNSSAPAQSESHYNNAPQIGDLGAAFGNAYQIYKQSQLMDKQIEAQELANQGQDIDNRLKSKDLNSYDKRFELFKQAADDASKKIMSDIQVNQQSIAESSARINEIAAREKLTLEQAATEVVNRAFLEESFQDRLEQIRLQNNLTKAQANQLIAATKLLLEQVITERAKQANINADTNLKNAQANSVVVQDNLSVTKLAAMIEDQFGGLITVNSDGTYRKTLGDNVGSDMALIVRSAMNYVGALISGVLPILGRRR